MRLQEMYYLVKNALDNWIEPKFSEQSKQKNIPLFICENPKEIINQLKALEILTSVSDVIQQLYAFGFASNTKPYFSRQQVEGIQHSIKRIHLDIQAMKSMCDVLDIKDNSVGFDVKLPQDIGLADLSECTKDLEFIFAQCPLLNDENSQIKLQGVDVGSSWLTFTLIGAAVGEIAAKILNNLAALVDHAMIIRSHSVTLKQQKEVLKRTQRGTELLKKMEDSYEEILKELTRSVADEIAVSHGISENEDKERIYQSLQRLDKWMERGLEIHAAINTSPEIKAAFPPIERQVLPYLDQHRLTQQSENTESE